MPLCMCCLSICVLSVFCWTIVLSIYRFLTCLSLMLFYVGISGASGYQFNWCNLQWSDQRKVPFDQLEEWGNTCWYTMEGNWESSQLCPRCIDYFSYSLDCIYKNLFFWLHIYRLKGYSFQSRVMKYVTLFP